MVQNTFDMCDEVRNVPDNADRLCNLFIVIFFLTSLLNSRSGLIILIQILIGQKCPFKVTIFIYRQWLHRYLVYVLHALLDLK